MSQSTEPETKFEKLKSYIPFVERMIGKLELNMDPNKTEYLDKLRTLSKFLKNPDSRYQDEQMLNRMEKIISLMYKSVGKGSASTSQSRTGSSENVSKDREKRDTSNSSSQGRNDERREERSKHSDEKRSHRDSHSSSSRNKDRSSRSREREYSKYGRDKDERGRNSVPEAEYRSSDPNYNNNKNSQSKSRRDHYGSNRHERHGSGCSSSSSSSSRDKRYSPKKNENTKMRELFGDESDLSSPRRSSSVLKDGSKKHSLLDLPMPPGPKDTITSKLNYSENNVPKSKESFLQQSSSVSQSSSGMSQIKLDLIKQKIGLFDDRQKQRYNALNPSPRDEVASEESKEADRPKTKFNFHEMKFEQSSFSSLRFDENNPAPPPPPLFPTSVPSSSTKNLYQTSSLMDKNKNISSSSKESESKSSKGLMSQPISSRNSSSSSTCMDKSTPHGAYPFPDKSPLRTNDSATCRLPTSTIKPTDVPLPTYPGVLSQEKEVSSSTNQHEEPHSHFKPTTTERRNSLPTKDPSSINMEAIQKALNFINSKTKRNEPEAAKKVSYRYEDFVGPASSKSDYYDPEESWENVSSSEGLCHKDVDLRNKNDVDFRQVPGNYGPLPTPPVSQFLPQNKQGQVIHSSTLSPEFSPTQNSPENFTMTTNTSDSQNYSKDNVNAAISLKDARDVDMRPLITSSPRRSSIGSSFTKPSAKPPEANVSDKGPIKNSEPSKLDTIRNRVTHDQDTFIKLGRKGIATSQLESLKQKREKLSSLPTKHPPAKGGPPPPANEFSSSSSLSRNSTSVLDQLLPETSDETQKNLCQSQNKNEFADYKKHLPVSKSNENNTNADKGLKTKTIADSSLNMQSKVGEGINSPLSKNLPKRKEGPLLSTDREDSNILSKKNPSSTGRSGIYQRSAIPFSKVSSDSTKDKVSKVPTPTLDPRTSNVPRFGSRDPRKDGGLRDPRSDPRITKFSHPIKDHGSEKSMRGEIHLPKDPRTADIQPENKGPRPPSSKFPIRRDPRLNSSEPPMDPRGNIRPPFFKRDPRIMPVRDTPHPEIPLQNPGFRMDSRWLGVGNLQRPMQPIQPPPPPPPPSHPNIRPGLLATPPHLPVKAPQFSVSNPKNSLIGQTFTCLMMQGLPHYANSSHIYKFFEEYLLRDICIELDQSYNCKGTAYIHFPNHLSAKEAFEKENGKFLHGHAICLRICSVGILRQAKAVNELQNFDREKYLNIPPRPVGNGNPFYKPKPKPPPPQVPPQKQPPAGQPSIPTTSSQQNVQNISNEENQKTGYSKLCGVKLDSQASKGLQSFKIPKLKKTPQSDGKGGNETDIKLDAGKKSHDENSAKPSENEREKVKSKEKEAPPSATKSLATAQSKKNRRYRKIIKGIESDSDSESGSSSPFVNSKSKRPISKPVIESDDDSDEESSLAIDESATVSSEKESDTSETESTAAEPVVSDDSFVQAKQKPSQLKKGKKKKKLICKEKAPVLPSKLSTAEDRVPRKRGRKKKSEKSLLANIKATKITRQKHVEFKEILSPRKKLPVIIPIPLKLTYNLLKDDKYKLTTIKRGPRRQKSIMVSPSPSETISEAISVTNSVCSSVDTIESLQGTHQSFTDAAASLDSFVDTDRELKSISDSDDCPSSSQQSSYSKRQLSSPINPKDSKKIRRVHNKWQKGYKKSGSPLPEITAYKVSYRKRSYSPRIQYRPRKMRKVSKDEKVVEKKIITHDVFEDDFMSDSELPDLTQITPSITEKEMNIFNDLQELSSLRSVIDDELDLSRENEKAKERIKMISNDLLETANKFTARDSKENSPPCSSTDAVPKETRVSNFHDDDEQEDLSLKVNQLVESLDQSLSGIGNLSEDKDSDLDLPSSYEAQSKSKKDLEPNDDDDDDEGDSEKISRNSDEDNLPEHPKVDDITESSERTSVNQPVVLEEDKAPLLESSTVDETKGPHKESDSNNQENISEYQEDEWLDNSPEQVVSNQNNSGLESVAQSIDQWMELQSSNTSGGTDMTHLSIEKNKAHLISHDSAIGETNASVPPSHASNKNEESDKESVANNENADKADDLRISVKNSENDIENSSDLKTKDEDLIMNSKSSPHIALQSKTEEELPCGTRGSHEILPSDQISTASKTNLDRQLETKNSSTTKESSENISVDCKNSVSSSKNETGVDFDDEKSEAVIRDEADQPDLSSEPAIPKVLSEVESSEGLEVDDGNASHRDQGALSNRNDHEVPPRNDCSTLSMDSSTETSVEVKSNNSTADATESSFEEDKLTRSDSETTLQSHTIDSNIRDSPESQSSCTPSMPSQQGGSEEKSPETAANKATSDAHSESGEEENASMYIEGSSNVADDVSTVSNEGSTSEQSSTTSQKKPKREKSSTINLIERRRITRGSLVVPQVTETILWDDGGIVDLFQCDQCDYVGKQRVSHLTNFHYEREVPCEFRKEDFNPVLRDTLGPPTPYPPKDEEDKLDLSWLPDKMIFDNEIECVMKGCDYNSNSRFDLVYHLLEHNPKAVCSVFHCRLCNFMSNDLTHFYDHVSSHTGEYRHTCARCGQRGFSVESLIHHHKDYHGSQSQEFKSSEMILEDGWPYIHICRSCHHVQIAQDKIEEHMNNKHNGKVDFLKANMSRHITLNTDRKKEYESAGGVVKPKEQELASSSKLKLKITATKKVARGKGKRLKRLKTKKKREKTAPGKTLDESVSPENLESIERETNIPVFLGYEKEDEKKQVEESQKVEKLVNRILLNNYTYKSSIEIKKKISTLNDILKKVDDSSNDDQSQTDSGPDNDNIKSIELPDKDYSKSTEINTKPELNLHKGDEKVQEKEVSAKSLSVSSSTSLSSVFDGSSDSPSFWKNLSNSDVTFSTKVIEPVKPLSGIISRLKSRLAEEDLMEKIKSKEGEPPPPDSKTQNDSDSESTLIICEDEDSCPETMDTSQESISTTAVEKGQGPQKVVKSRTQTPHMVRAQGTLKCRMTDCIYLSSTFNELMAHFYQTHQMFLCINRTCDFISGDGDLYDSHNLMAHKRKSFICPLPCVEKVKGFPSQLVRHLAVYHFNFASKNETVSITLPDNQDTDNEEDGGFLRIESCRTLDPQSASQLFNSEEAEFNKSEMKNKMESSSFPGPQPPNVATNASQEISAPVKIKEENVSPCKAGIKKELQSPPRIKKEPWCEDKSFPGAESLPLHPPTVPLLQLFSEYQSFRAFSAYTIGKAQDIFKCMHNGCVFSTDEVTAFENHCRTHLTTDHRCSYCLVKMHSGKSLIDHILAEHSHCPIQCKYCLYRAATKVYLGVHLRKFHPEKEPRYIKVGIINSEPPPNPPIENFVHHFKCTFENCTFQSVDTDAFKVHVNSTHGTEVKLPCTFCEVVFDLAGLILHMNVHMMSEYQCPYCLFGDSERDKLVTHLLNCHPGRPGKVLLRRQVTQAVSGGNASHQNAPSTCATSTSTPSTTIISTTTTTVSRTITTSTATTVVSASPSISSSNQTMKLTSKTGETNALMPRTSSPAPALPPPSNALPPPSLSLPSTRSSSPLVTVSSGESSTPPTTALITTTPLDQTGLVGNALYRCGNKKCEYSCPSAMLLKEHLQVCDYSRDSPLLKCYHCTKYFRHLSSLLDHIKVHGPKRYMCGVEGCDYRSTMPHYFKNHMKQTHPFTGFKCVLKDFANKNPETQEFIVYPKDIVSGFKEPHKKRRNEFGIEDIDKIPRAHVAYQELKCYHCMYSSKIRLNLVKHLKLHQKLPNGMPSTDSLQDVIKTIPSKQPVNPVPRLERKELMFDKMMNLAGSSFEDKKKVEQNELRLKYPIPQEESDGLPGFVPGEKLYSCAICNYMSCGETMLKCHIKTLHSEVEQFPCPHCKSSYITLDNLASHFKLHGEALYRCGWCTHLTTRKALVERHLKEKHPNQIAFDFCIRGTELEKDEEGKEEGSSVGNLSTSGVGKPGDPSNQDPQWQCGICPYKASIQNEMVNHTSLKHGIKSQYKCGYCQVRSSVRTAFDTHFAAKHPDKAFRVLCMFYRLDSNDIEPLPPGGSYTSHEPLWRRNDPERRKQIRGILLEEENDEHELNFLNIQPGDPKGEEFVCPKCHSFKTPCMSTFRSHLCKEANYQRFECAECGVTNPLLPTLRRHYTKTHGSQFTKDCYITLPVESTLEAWVESIISHQQHMIKLWKENGSNASSSPTKSTSRRSSCQSESEEGQGVVLHDSGSDKNKYTCTICGVECRTGSGLKSHTTAMHQAKFKCQYCPFSSNTELGIQNHRALKHPKQDTQEVSKSSPKATPSSAALGQGSKSLPEEKDDPRSNDKTGDYSCRRCNFKTNQVRSFRSHTRTHPEYDSYICGYCGARFDKQSAGNKHSTLKHPSLPPKITYSPFKTEDDDKGTAVKEEASSAGEKEGGSESSSSQETKEAVIMYSCCHCSTKGAHSSVEEHVKAQHRDLPFLIRKETESSLYLETYNYKCGHCLVDSVSLVEAMNHWIENHVTLDFRFSLALFSSKCINLDSKSTSSALAKGGSSPCSSSESLATSSPISKAKALSNQSKLEVSISSEADDTLDDLDTSASDALEGGTDSEVDQTAASSQAILSRCGYCRKVSPSSEDIIKHIQKSHKDKPLKFIRLPVNEYNKKYKALFECDYCGNQGTVTDLTKHTLKVHLGKKLSYKRVFRGNQNDKIRFRCDVCGHVVKAKKSIKYHMNRHHPERTLEFTKIEFESAPKPPTKQPMKCNYCGDTASTVEEIESHHRFLHSHLSVSYSNLRDEALQTIHKSSSSLSQPFQETGPHFSSPGVPFPTPLSTRETSDVKPSVAVSSRIKNTARKSFPAAAPTVKKKQIATKSTSGRLALIVDPRKSKPTSSENPVKKLVDGDDDDTKKGDKVEIKHMVKEEFPSAPPPPPLRVADRNTGGKGKDADDDEEIQEIIVEEKDPLDLNEIYASVNLLGNAPRRLSIMQLSVIQNINPKVVVEDINGKSDSPLQL